MTSDHDKFVKVATQELHQLQSSSSSVAADVAVPLLIGALIIGVFLSIWIFRGGLSRSSRSIAGKFLRVCFRRQIDAP